MDEPPGYTVAILFQLSQFFVNEAPGVILVALLCALWIAIAIAEAAFFTLSAEDLSKISQGRKHWERSVMTLMNYPQHVQVTNLFLRSSIKISIVAWMVLLAWPYHYTWVWLSCFALSVSVMVLFGDLLARRIGVKYRSWILRHGAFYLRILAYAFLPLSTSLLWLQEVVINVLGRRSKASEKAASRVLTETLNEVNVNEEYEMFKSMSNFGALSVRQIMRQRKDVMAIDVAKDFSILVEMINQYGFSRIPVYRSTIDTIEGVLYTKDLIPFVDQQRGFEWQKLIRPAFFVSESTRLSVLLKDFQQKHVHIAVVLDKYGRVVGLITLQDLIEEVIDDINEEFDSVNPGT